MKDKHFGKNNNNNNKNMGRWNVYDGRQLLDVEKGHGGEGGTVKR